MISKQLQMLIPSKCPGVVDEVKVTSGPEPSAAQQKQEANTQHRWDLFRIVISVFFFCSIARNSCSFRSAAADAPPEGTAAPSVVSAADVDLKEITAAAIEETVKEAPTPVVVQPPHTSPKPSFASEVRVRGKTLKLKKDIKKTCICTNSFSVLTGTVENHPVAGPESDCQRQHDGWYGERKEWPLCQNQCWRVSVQEQRDQRESQPSVEWDVWGV